MEDKKNPFKASLERVTFFAVNFYHLLRVDANEIL